MGPFDKKKTSLFTKRWKQMLNIKAEKASYHSVEEVKSMDPTLWCQV